MGWEAMEEQPDNVGDVTSDKPAKPFIPPPPVLSQNTPPPPPSPLDSIPRSAPPPPPLSHAAEPVVKVKLREEGDGIEVTGGGMAPFNPRIIAAVIDVLVATGLAWGLILILPGFASRLGYLASIGYLLTRDALPFLGGQSVGKKAMKLQAVTLDGQPLTGKWESSVIRNISMVIPVMPLVELFVLLTREDKPERGRRLGDEWAKTKVIVEVRPPAADGGV